MITIEKIDSSNFQGVIDFLKSVPSIEKIDEDILDNACIACNDEKIVGCISFEKYSDKGLIRYFVFKKVLAIEYLEDLMSCLEETAVNNGINKLVCVAECSQIEELFKNLNFVPITQKNIFINEEHVLNTSFKSALFLTKPLH